MDKRWLPEGHHWDLHIEKHSIGSNLSFVTPSGWKLIWHTTESPWEWYDTGVGFFTGGAKGSSPHFLIGGRNGFEHPYVAQFVPLDESSFALVNDAGDGLPTNRAHCIQVEVCGRAADMATFGHYRALANLFELINHRQPIENWTHATSGTTPPRFTDSTFVGKRGHVGHNMVPDNNHTDPGQNFRWGTLQNLIRDIPEMGYAL